MVTVEEARNIILNNTYDFGTEEIPFLESVGRILKEDIIADRDFPPFNRVAMDGIAINHRFFEYGVRDFKIEGIQPAGSKQAVMENAAHCYEVMTGAVLPYNTDTVIRYEDLKINSLMATVIKSNITKGQNIHLQGSDSSKNDILIKKNTVISPAEIGVLATVGKTLVKVALQPKVIIISTGDELVEVNQTPLAHQIRKSNVYTLVSLLQKANINPKTSHLTDEKSILKIKIASYLQEYDVLIFSGAVSKGKFDFLPKVFRELEVQKLFYGVSQRPGKPFWAGIASASDVNKTTLYKNLLDKTMVFAFPGNPVSTFVNCMVYFFPWYYKCLCFTQPIKKAILAKDISFKPNLTRFLQVTLFYKKGQLLAMPIIGNGSGDLASLVKADGFIELPKKETSTFKKGTVFSVITYRDGY